MKNPEQNSVDYARDVVGRDPMARHLGIEVLEVREAYSRVAITVKPENLNALDRVHGVTVFAVADQAMAVAANSRGVSAMLLEAKINYLSSATLGDRLVAEARPVDLKRKIGLWNVEIRVEGSPDLVAVCQGVSYHKT
jgi:acyl-CoA thioesterase